MYGTMIAVALTAAVVMILYVISESLSLYEEYSERKTSRRREFFRKKAYAEMDRSRAEKLNRQQLRRQLIQK